MGHYHAALAAASVQGAFGAAGRGIWSLVSGLAVITILTSVVGRLLGIRLRWWRALVAGFPGIIAGFLFDFAISGHNTHAPPKFSPAVVLLAAVPATMIIAVMIELLSRPGRLANVQSHLVEARKVSIPHPIRALRARLARTRRYFEVTRIAAQHGLAPYLGFGGRDAELVGRQRLGRNLRLALEDGGGMFVKLGQAMSTRADMLPPEVIAELSGLQDGVAPALPAEIEALLVEELGAPPSEVFAEFEAAPLAAASIAQAHRARLRSGEQVVVKVQRPGIRALVERDLDIMLRLARTLEARTSWAAEYRVVRLAQGFANSLLEELDFRVEARNIAAVAQSIDLDGQVVLPVVHAGLSTARVLVLGWMDGPSVRDASPLLDRLGADRRELARELLRCLLDQIMRGGAFHADPHPGNVLVLPDGRLGLLDFGSVGRLDPIEQAALRNMLIAIDRRDAAQLTDSILEIVQIREPADEDLMEHALAQFMAQHLGAGMVPDAAMFTALFQLLMDFGIVFPPELAAVFRALVTLEGTLNVFAPGFRIVDEARALAAEWLQESLRPDSLQQAATNELMSLLPILRRLPRRLDRIATAAEQGTLSASVRVLADRRDTRFLAGLVDRAVLAFIGAALGVMSVLLIGTRTSIGPAITSSLTVLQLFGYLGLFISVVLILRVIVAIARAGTI